MRPAAPGGRGYGRLMRLPVARPAQDLALVVPSHPRPLEPVDAPFRLTTGASGLGQEGRPRLLAGRTGGYGEEGRDGPARDLRRGPRGRPAPGLRCPREGASRDHALLGGALRLARGDAVRLCRPGHLVVKGTAVLAALLAGCTGSRPPPPLAVAWRSTLQRDHPLTGRIWDVRRGRLCSVAELEAGTARARFLLLGEAHDNPDHHALQAQLLRAATAGGRRPALAMEMLDPEQQGAVDAALGAPHPTPEAFRDAVGWDKSGWPPFELYRPIVDAALAARLPLVAANLSRSAAREVVHRGPTALPQPLRALLERTGPLPAAEAQDRREEMQAEHCGLLPEDFLDPMVLSQRARDAQLARALLDGATAAGGVLVTGAEHARRDRGAPAFLLAAGVAPGDIVSVAFREVEPGAEEPKDYAPLPWDFVVFTPGTLRGDPCEELRRPPAGEVASPGATSG